MNNNILTSIYLIMGGEFYGTGGWAKYVKELAYFLTSHGYQVKIVYKMGKNFSYHIKIKMNYSDNIKFNQTRVISKLSRISSFYWLSHLPNPLTVILGVIRTMKEIRCDRVVQKIIHAHDLSSSFFIAFLLWKFLKVPYVVQVHGFPLREWKIKLMRADVLTRKFVWFLTKMLHIIAIYLIKNSSALLLTNNNEVKSFYEGCGISSDRIKVVPSAINLCEHRKHLLLKKEARKSLGLMESEIVTIGYVGGLKPEKNVGILIKAFEEFVKSYPDAKARLLIIGDGPMRPVLEEYVKEHNIDGYVSFLGYVPDAYRFLNAIDIFVLPSLSEGSPIALIEAMACSRAIIASNIPAIKEIVEDGREALLFDPHSPEQLKEALLKLYYDPELRKTLGKNAKEKAKQYDVNVVFPKIVKIYQRVLRKQD